MKRTYLAASVIPLLLTLEAHAHFALEAPPAYSVQDADGLPEKSAPCGQADPGDPVVPTHAITSFHSGDTITVTIDEKIFHPGHYRVALAMDQASLPADPIVAADANSPCGTAQIQSSMTPGVLVDNMLPHTTAFTVPQSFQVTLPTGMTCTNCTLQVIEFMSDHSLNNPGGCFYHHCAQVTIVPQNTPLPDAGVVSIGGNDAGAQPPGNGGGGGCDVGTPGVAPGVALVLLAALGLSARRRRKLMSHPEE
jgi:hypothetical protein